LAKIKITSLEDSSYNCIAWAAEDSDSWWWPAIDAYWPEGVEREETILSFVRAYATLGYEECADGSLEAGFQKIAIYTDARGIPTHAARQLETGAWASKLGKDCDIEHFSLEDVHQWPNVRYGKVSVFLRRLKR
jgi:hypothetical protein